MSRENDLVPFVEKATCSIAMACSGTGLGRTKIYELIAENKIQTKYEGRRRLVMVPSLLAHVGYNRSDSTSGTDTAQ